MAARNVVQVVIQGKDEASKPVGGVIESLGKFGLAVQGLRFAVDIIKDIGGAILGMVKDAATLQGVEEAFDGITKAAGKNADEVLRSFKKFSAGMLTERDAMLAYNTATQLVGEQFANTLPEAMSYLSKIASATGQDMGFMTDSLVKGIGRLSPMILDNLGIQVDLNEAYEVYAKSIGKSVDDLTKQEKQTALLNQVMDKLKTNTAAMPDVAGQADTEMAKFGATMEDIRGKIGMFFIPVFTDVLNILNGIANAVMVLVTGDFTGGIFGFDEDHPVIIFLFELRNLLQAVSAGVPFFDALSVAITNIAAAADDYGLEGLVDALMEMHRIVVEILKPIGDWISANIQLSDILTAIGITIGSIIVPAIISIGTAIAVPLAAFAALVAAIALVRKLWDENFLGIRDFVMNSLIPAFQEIIRVVGEVVEAFIGWVQQNPDVIAGIAGIVAIALTAGAVVAALTGGVTLLTSAFALLFSPISMIALAIAALLELLGSQEGGIIGAITRAATAAQQLAFIVMFVLSAAFEWFKTQILIPVITFLQSVAVWVGEVIRKMTELGSKINEIAGPLKDILGGGGFGAAFDVQNFMNPQARDNGGSVVAGNPYQIGVPEYFVPHTGGDIVPLGGAGGTGGAGNQITIQFMGSGGPTDQQEADDAGFMIVNAMRARGVEV